MLRKAGGAALLAALAYTAHDAAADSAMLWRSQSLVMTQATSNPRFAAAVGAPIQAGPWYNSSVAISHDGHIATVTMQLRGSQRSSDVTVRLARRGGLRSTLLYNLVGGGEWDVLIMNALIGMGPGGVPISMSLLQHEEPDPAAAAAAARTMGHGERGMQAAEAAAAARQQQQTAAAAKAAAKAAAAEQKQAAAAAQQ